MFSRGLGCVSTPLGFFARLSALVCLYDSRLYEVIQDTLSLVCVPFGSVVWCPVCMRLLIT